MTATQAKIAEFQMTKENIEKDLDAKKVAMEGLTASVQQAMMDASGHWKGKVEQMITNAERIVEDHARRITELEAAKFENRGAGSRGSDSVDKAGNWNQRGLIFEKELKVPSFPDSPKVESFGG